jgi:outer membrane protein assembly factor BamE (lipoprotein component of BamABCDE complex)
MMVVRAMLVAIVTTGIGACAIQRAQVAQDAQSQMVGMSKEQVLACMGPPASKAAEGATEVWSYASGNGHTTVSTFESGGRGYASGFGVAEQRFCTVNVTMTSGRVSRMNYVGPTGGLLTQGEQCAFALQNCVQPQ